MGHNKRSEDFQRPSASAIVFLAFALLFGRPPVRGAGGGAGTPAPAMRQEAARSEIVRIGAGNRSRLHQAVIDDDIGALKAEIAKGSDPDAKDGSGRTALHLALEMRRPEALKLLIAAGADTSLALPNGDAPLKHAVMTNNLGAAEAIFFSERNRTLALDETAAHRPLALHAIKTKRYSQAEMFVWPLHYIVKRDRFEYLEHVLKVERRFLNQKDEKGMTPLHIAYMYRRDRFVEPLKAAGADISARDVYGKAPADYRSECFSSLTDINLLDDPTRIKIDDRMLDFLMHHEWLTIGVVKEGRIAFLKTYGHRSMIDQDAVHASISKPMTSLIVLQVWKQGLIGGLDDDISRYSRKYRDIMPAAYAGEKITFRHILTHTSGIPHINKPLWSGGKLNLLFKPGSRFEYSTNAFSILGEILAETTGKSFSDLVKEYIGGPIGASSFWAEADFRAPAARIHSTTRDFVRFAQGIIDNRYLTERELDEILVGTNPRESLGWGTLDIGTDDLTLGHSGSNGKPRSHFLIKPKKKIALVLMGETKTRDSDIWFLELAPILFQILEGKGGY